MTDQDRLTKKAETQRKITERKHQAQERFRELAPLLAQAGGSFDPLVDLYVGAIYADCHEQTLREAVREQEIGCVRNGSRGFIKFRLSQLNTWLKRKEKRVSRRAQAD